MSEMILPPAHGAFEWRTFTHDALVCGPLAQRAAHFFTTRAWALGSSRSAVDDRDGWAEVARAIGVNPRSLVHMRQVHGDAVVVAPPDRPLAEADIVITDDPGCAIAVQGADCVPLLVADARLGVVAAAHAGWRGMTKRVPGSAVAALARTYGSRPDDLIVAAGPSIGACCYQVGSDVRDGFAAEGFDSADLDRWFLPLPAELPANPPLPSIDRSARDGRWYLDLWSVLRHQLEDAGVAGDRVFVAGLCTASHPDMLCSYRRDGRHAGRLAAVIRPGGARNAGLLAQHRGESER